MTREKEIYKVTLVGSAGNAALLTFKFIAGVLGNSSAMVADAVHSLSDFVTDILVLVFVSISAKPQDRSHDYGHGKFETIASFLIGLTAKNLSRLVGLPFGRHFCRLPSRNCSISTQPDREGNSTHR